MFLLSGQMLEGVSNDLVVCLASYQGNSNRTLPTPKPPIQGDVTPNGRRCPFPAFLGVPNRKKDAGDKQDMP